MSSGAKIPPESFEDFLKTSRTGHIYASPDGTITFVNDRVAKWLETDSVSLLGTHVSDHFSISGKVYFQTHLGPLLKLRGFFDEVALELAPLKGARIPVIVNGTECTDEKGTPLFIRLSLLATSERRQFERNLVTAKTIAVADSARLRQLNVELGGQIAEERETAALREQFIAVLGHDLRNPLAAIDGALRLIRKTPLNERATAIAEMVHMSVGRMASLIDDVMDFARGRLGNGIEVKLREADIEPVLKHVVDELRTSWPGRNIEAAIALSRPITCDAKRVAQLLSNLVGNALAHGAPEGPIWVRASTDDKSFELSVSNEGEKIPSASLERLFEPFTREDARPSQQGLGLGLYIASQIAKAHRGTLSVSSSELVTQFTFKMPLDA